VDNVGARVGFLRVLWFPLPIFISVLIITRGRYNRPEVADVPSGPSLDSASPMRIKILLVVTMRKCSINPINNPIPVYSHTHTHDNKYICTYAHGQTIRTLIPVLFVVITGVKT
jgi:hypothetical protein